MLERYVAEALTTHFGHLVQGLDADKVRLSAWKGELVFDDLILRPDALQQAGIKLPLHVAYGHVGRLYIQIPWKLLVRDQLVWGSSSSTTKSAATDAPTNDDDFRCSVVLTDVNILIAPSTASSGHDETDVKDEQQVVDDDDDFSAVAHEQAIQSRIDAVLVRRVAQVTSKRKQWAQKLVQLLLANLTVTIRNIHVRYQDYGRGFCDFKTQYRDPFAVGVTLKEFRVSSQNQGDESTIHNLTDDDFDDDDHKNSLEANAVQSVTVKRKRAAAQDLAAYWDSNARTLPSELSQIDYQQFFDVINDGAEHSYLLDAFSPVVLIHLVDAESSTAGSASAAASPAHGASQEAARVDARRRPPSSVRFVLPPCRFAISRSVLEELGYLRTALRVWKETKFLSDGDLRRLAKLRPHQSAAVNAKGWWTYAFHALLAIAHADDDRSKRKRVKGWLGLARAVGKRNRYMSLYQRVLLPSNIEQRNHANVELLALEKELLVEEVVAFRLYCCRVLQQNLGIAHVGKGKMTTQNAALSREGGHRGPTPVDSILSADNRLRMFDEMTILLEQERILEVAGDAEDISNFGLARNKLECPGKTALWILKCSCPELSLQVNDRAIRQGGSNLLPVLVVSFAFLQEQKLYDDKSWKLTTRLGSLLVKNCTHTTRSGSILFPNLVGAKGCKRAGSQAETFTLGDVTHHQTAHVQVQRLCHSDTLNGGRGSSTVTRIRVLPVEIVYSTAPFEALSRILNVANVNFKSDYQGMADRLSRWRRQQQARLLHALAHKEKSIIIDLDIGAPVLLVPEDDAFCSPLLVIDLGRLLFRNAEISVSEFDDKWSLELTDMQVTCTTSRLFRDLSRQSTENTERTHHLIEPFSIEFAILTKITLANASAEKDETMMRVTARLPKLILNGTTSAMRLLKRLQMQWITRKSDIEHLHWYSDSARQQVFPMPQGAFQTSSHYKLRQAVDTAGVFDKVTPGLDTPDRRRLEFIFAAPLLRVYFQNDVDGRDSTITGNASTPLIVLSFRGIDGNVLREETATNEKHLSWTARLRAMDALDLFQQAGQDFSFLLSSVSPDLLPVQSSLDETYDNGSPAKDLLAFEYTSEIPVKSRSSDGRESRLAVYFHELYVEWNPETLAAIQQAISMPRLLPVTEPVAIQQLDPLIPDEDFVDAEEEEFFDAMSHHSTDALSTFSGDEQCMQPTHETTKFMSVPFEQLPYELVDWNDSGDGADEPVPSATLAQQTGLFTVSFELSKLRMRFNKETRHRRLFVAEMDSTSVNYSTNGTGSWTSHVSVGNLTFADAASLLDLTLYREILGLKTVSGQSSLLKLDIKKFSRRRRYVMNVDGHVSSESDEGVVIDCGRQEVHGCDVSLQAHFSPMRFVFLQQLWFEIFDYFFEGIMGAEVWGSGRVAASETAVIDAPNADHLSFTRFKVVLESPLIVFPVSYCSPDYLHIEANTITFANAYTCSDMRVSDDVCGRRCQWFNNCDISLQEIRILTSSGSCLTNLGCAFAGDVSLNWPTGPTAQLNCPKWKVACTFGSVRLTLERDDYVLLQHVVQFNICEESRHLDEWEALESLPADALERYKRGVMVNFGYDKKDVTPTTYEITLAVPLLSFNLYHCAPVADIQCENVLWTMRKLSDLKSRQRVDCDVELLGIEGDRRIPLMVSNSLPVDRLPAPIGEKDLVYESVADPSGDSSKWLTIADARICLLYSMWLRCANFFKGIPGPTLVHPEEVIQIGDRWYKIKANEEAQLQRTSQARLNWINALRMSDATKVAQQKLHHVKAFQFQLSLVRPSLLIGSKEYGLVLKADGIDFIHKGQPPRISRRFNFANVQLQTKSDTVHMLTTSGSLIKPWSCNGSMFRCSCESVCSCSMQEFIADAGMLEARASFIDMTVALEVLLRFFSDIREAQRRRNGAEHGQHLSTESGGLASSTKSSERCYSATWKGLKLILIDDSGRHFATSQELAIVSLKDMAFRRTETLSSVYGKEFYMHLTFAEVHVIDALQSPRSPFRVVLEMLSHHEDSPASVDGDAMNSGNPVAVEFTTKLAACRTCHIRIGACELQYNPSMVIAIQRFIGRFTKDARLRMEAISVIEFGSGYMYQTSDALRESATASEAEVTVNGKIEVTTLTLRLNKEHQGRQLLATTVSNCLVHAKSSSCGLGISGHIGSIVSFGIRETDGIRLTLLRASGSSHFLRFCYQTFADRKPCTGSDELPVWVLKHSKEQPEIDDCLDIQMSTLEVTILRDRMMELVDYLSNGMPGRGMGATGEAAKGFVQNRIQTRSFLQLSAEAPTVFIPIDDTTDYGILCRLGDFTVKSWVDGLSSTRNLTVAICGLSAMRSRAMSAPGESTIVSKIDISVELEKSELILSGKIRASDVHVPLKYSDYILLMDVVENNVGRKVSRAAWDNLEAAWDVETERDQAGRREDFLKDLEYSSSARIVRYGKKPVANSRAFVTDVQFLCNQVSVILIRDDCPVAVAVSVAEGYDILFFSIRRLQASFKKEGRNELLAGTLHRLYVFDVNDRRRGSGMVSNISNDGGYSNSAYTVLAEGYSAEAVLDGCDNQVDIKIDRGDSRMDASVVVNYLSLTAFIRPYEELFEFFSRSWAAPDVRMAKTETVILGQAPEGSASDSGMQQQASERSLGTSYASLKLVLHYPRVILTADESELHSRGLILEGLAMAHVKVTRPAGFEKDAASSNEVRFIQIQADFQNVSSHIYPDIFSFVCVNSSHQELLPGLFQPCLGQGLTHSNPDGLPFLLPLTIGVEYEERVYERAPRVRALSLNVDSLSVMLGTQDVSLFRALFHKWPVKPRSNKSSANIFAYDVVFDTAKLGLGLRKVHESIVVDHIEPHAAGKTIEKGDVLYAINRAILSDMAAVALSDIVDHLAVQPRPLTISFLRPLPPACPAGEHMLLAPDYGRMREQIFFGSDDSIDLSLSRGVIILMEEDVTLLRAVLTKTAAQNKQKVTCGATYQLKFVSDLALSYYNLRAWVWEPLLEPSGLILMAGYQNPRQGSRELAVEFSDRHGPLCINVTDAGIESISKLSFWGVGDDSHSHAAGFEEGTQELMYHEVAGARIDAQKAANAALQFAQRQKCQSAKPFVIRNRSGGMIAFALQKSTPFLDSGLPFVANDDYPGMREFPDKDVFVVRSDEEQTFYEDVVSDEEKTIGRRFPLVTIAIQATQDIAVDPIRDLDVSQTGETMVPLFAPSSSNLPGMYQEIKGWASWTVEQTMEKTVLTFGGSIQMISSLRETVEVAISTGKIGADASVTIGKCSAGSPLHLPLWLMLCKNDWNCLGRFEEMSEFTPLFGASNLNKLRTTYIKMLRGVSPSRFISLSVYHVEGAYTVSIDCGISYRNLLPTNIEWEVTKGLHPDAIPIDGSAHRAAHNFLESGEHVEIFSNGQDELYTQIRLVGGRSWSSSVPLYLPHTVNAADRRPPTALYDAQILDEFGVASNIGVRVARKGGCVDVIIFAELWCANFTSLPLVFGCPTRWGMQEDQEEVKSTDLSAAEAALKEISSLFEGGIKTGPSKYDDAISDTGGNGIHCLPEQCIPEVVYEYFEYIEMANATTIKRRWFAGEDPSARRPGMAELDSLNDLQWLDDRWVLDKSSGINDGWESSSTLAEFSMLQGYNVHHQFRRRRWYRRRSGCASAAFIKGVTAFYQPARRRVTGKDEEEEIKLAVQTDGGRWSTTPLIPNRGVAHGVLRVAKARWPNRRLSHTGKALTDKAIYELCYSVAPLDDDWGDVSRLLVLTSRFLLRNDSKSLVFEVKQAGTIDTSATQLKPGATVPFHWSDIRLPMLISVRPCSEANTAAQWSGGLDPLMIGAVSVKIRYSNTYVYDHASDIVSIKVETEIRSRSGGTGINVAFTDEDSRGYGALFRVENTSCFPIWFIQDGLLANNGVTEGDKSYLVGDLVRPKESAVFALDVPFRQGKYKGREVASMAELMRARVALAPLNSRSGIETTKVISMTATGGRVRLNPYRLSILPYEMRSSVRRVRVVGTVLNDGPTRVLRFGLMVKPDSSAIFSFPFSDDAFGANLTGDVDQAANYLLEMTDAALTAKELLKNKALAPEDDAIMKMVLGHLSISTASRNEMLCKASQEGHSERDMIISFRLSLSGFVISLVDSAPSEICVIYLDNINAIATWNLLRTVGSTMYVTATGLHVDNMVPNAPFLVAVAPTDVIRTESSSAASGNEDLSTTDAPLLVIGISVAPKHNTGVVCFKSITVAPRNLAVNVDLAFLVRLQKFGSDILSHFRRTEVAEDWSRWTVPDIACKAKEIEQSVSSTVDRQKFFFEGMTILPCQVKLSIAPARALTHAQATLEGRTAAAIHQAVRKGDVQLGNAGLLGVKVGHRNATPLAVVRGVFKSIVVDALLRLDGANLEFAGVALYNHTSTSSQLLTNLGAHYMASFRQNVPALLGSLAAFGNPLGLVRGLGDGVSDFVLEPVKGFQRSVQQMDASHLVDGVARGTLSLARHTVGGIADSAAMLTETFSKNMTILTLDRRYAQRRDRKEILREQGGMNIGIGSGVTKLAQGFVDGVTGVVKAPLRGAEKKGFEGFAKGMGKGLLGLLVKPIIGISDGLTDVMMGVKGTVDGGGTGPNRMQLAQMRPRRALYGPDHVLRVYNVADAAAAALMMRTRLAGERYLNHLDMGDRVALLSIKRMLLLGPKGEELLLLKYKHIESMQVQSIELANGDPGWGIIVVLNTPRRNGSDLEVINCRDRQQASELRDALEQGMDLEQTSAPSERSHMATVIP